MSFARLHRRLLSTALAASLVLTGAGCGAPLSDSELDVGEAASFLTASEESGDIGRDALVGASSQELSDGASEDSALSTDTTEPTSGVCEFSAKREQVLAQYDTNKDGRLDRAELLALREDLAPARSAPLFQRLAWRARSWAFWRVRWAFDENGDRTLSDTERAALVDAMEARCERLRASALERFDANHDGTLDASERQAAREAFRQRLQARRAELLAKYDTNKNGVLEDTERAQLRADRLAAAQARRAELMATYDKNGDGRLSTEEALPLRKAIQERIINGHDAE